MGQDWLNVDAGFHDEGKVGSMGFCCRNSNGTFVTAATSWKANRVSVVEGEAAALLEAMQFARTSG
ncbi:hypothetical protein TSUD_309920 [Trifolium subterraneum]|uniref:RNase H type-1 domain-containing protein n=1 Tax=Trifolium subterraneum TaxID=3900 RepID=A0A2Z6LVN4_TRISU|nr:hypothetical protein TSUD_309920 [Trifolium subterraneum]